MTDVKSSSNSDRLLRGSDLKGVKLYKILRWDLTHFGFVYKEGWNELQQAFNPSGDCEPGGLYITGHPELWIMMGTKIASVTLPDDAQVWKGNDKYKVDKLILGPITPILNETYLASIQQCGSNVQHIPQERRTQRLLFAAVRQDGESLQYVRDPPLELCFAAVERHPWAKRFVPSCYYDEVDDFEAIVHYECRLTNIPLCTLALCIAVVRRYPDAIKDVPDYHHAEVLSAIRGT